MGKSLFDRLVRNETNNPSYIMSILSGERYYNRCFDSTCLTEDGNKKSTYHVSEFTSKRTFSEVQEKLIKGNPCIFVSSIFVDMQHERAGRLAYPK